MNTDYITAVGQFGQAIADLCLKKDPALAFTDFMKGLASFGVHSSIQAALQTPAGEAAPKFKAMFADKPADNNK